ncbi:MAG: hypothetical protein M3Q26_08780 [Acidobacteriota bacterium]|nr:hypothetical protein [Acidobacteriota bacterium]
MAVLSGGALYAEAFEWNECWMAGAVWVGGDADAGTAGSAAAEERGAERF